MTLDRVVPVDREEVAARSEVEVDRDEAQVGRKEQVPRVLFIVAIAALDPAVDLDAIGGLVADLDEAAVHIPWKSRRIDEGLAAGA